MTPIKVQAKSIGYVERLFPFYVDTLRPMGFERDRWCIDTFGPKWNMDPGHPGRWIKLWLGLEVEADPNRYRWRFREEKDLMWFILRWLSV